MPLTERQELGVSHLPLLHICEVEHFTPHVPQLLTSVWVSTHAPEQLVKPWPQTKMQEPL
jgi:hypothetical protein